jgi:hypothetical protein
LAGKEERYVAVRAATYCGAVSLTRILSLATGQLFGINSVLDESSLFLDDLSPDSGGISPGNYNTRPNLNPNAHARLWDHQLIPQKLFQLTEWVHKLITSAQSDAQTTIHEILPVYNKCLDWYNNFFFFLNADGSRTPFVLFVHMYYHFCLLCAFRPFLGHHLGGSDIKPRQICSQAAQSILALSQSYDDLFSLRRVSGLIPYFVCASGLFSLAIEDSTSRMDPVHMRVKDNAPPVIKTEPKEHKSDGAPYAASAIPPHAKISAAAHARLLLTRMGSTHPAATVAARVLQAEIGSTPGD